LFTGEGERIRVSSSGEGRPSSQRRHPRERRLRVTLWNGKELPVTVWDLHVEFYKGGELLEEGARPRVELVEESGNISELRQVILPPYIPVSLVIRVSPLGAHDTDQEQAAKLRALEEADRAEFVANIVGIGEKREELRPPGTDACL
jgi:hypothetical protein